MSRSQTHRPGHRGTDVDFPRHTVRLNTMIRGVVSDLSEEARAENERRLIVLTGDHDHTVDTAVAALDSVPIDPSQSLLITTTHRADIPMCHPDETRSILGTTLDALIYDAHDALEPNALARAIGTVTGGGLIILCAPPLDTWTDMRNGFDETLAIPPTTPQDVTARFRTRLIKTLRTHPGIAIIDLSTDTIQRTGCTERAPHRDTPQSAPILPTHNTFPDEAYEACLTQDQADALATLERLTTTPMAVVLESDRGRGKSSLLGLAAASLAYAGEHIAITAPTADNTRDAFDRATELLDDLEGDRTEHRDPDRIETTTGGTIQFVPPTAIDTASPDVLLVDEAAALPVRLLTTCLKAHRIAFATTVHGYEGTGRGFAVRFHEHLERADHTVERTTLSTPIRYAPGDPIETWAFRAFLLDARPAHDSIVDTATPTQVNYRALDAASLVEDESRLREVFGLLVLAHYQTEPNDLARLLDAPNIHIRVLIHDDHVVSVALLAEEGALPSDSRRRMYEGTRIKGHMLPDLLTSQLRDETAARLAGLRVLRIATHPAVRSRGLGSTLLDHVETEFEDAYDWFGTSYGATPDLISFWHQNGYSTIHLSTTRNDTSGEHSVVMLNPLSPEGVALHDRHATWFANRVPAVLTDALASLEPDIARHALRTTDTTVTLTLTDAEWRHVASMAYGPGLIDIDPRPFRHLAIKHLIDPTDPACLSARQECLLVLRVLQARKWDDAKTQLDELGHETIDSTAGYHRALGAAYRRLVDQYGPSFALAERDRY